MTAQRDTQKASLKSTKEGMLLGLVKDEPFVPGPTTG